MSAFVKASLERAVKTAAQTAVALIGTNAVGVTDIDWVGVGSGAGLAAILSVLTSIASGGFGTGTASLVGEKLPD